MPTYEYECKAGHVTEDFRTMSKRNDPCECEECGKKAEMIISGGAEIMTPDKPFDFKQNGVNLARGVRTPAQQEKMYGKMIDETRKHVRKKVRADKNRLSKSDDMTMHARIPRELYSARTRQFGKNYWTDEGTRALKRDGLVVNE